MQELGSELGEELIHAVRHRVEEACRVWPGLNVDENDFLRHIVREIASQKNPAEALTKELDGVKADTSIGETDKKQLVDQLTEAIKSTPKVENKENVGIVKAHRAEIEKALQ